MNLLLELVAVAALILLNAFFVASEYGLITSRRTRIRELESEGHRRARMVTRITADPPRFIAAMQLGVTVTSLGIGALGEPALAREFRPGLADALAVVVALILITLPEVVIGELVPKAIALKNPEKTALALSTPIRIYFTVFGPLIWFLQRTTELVLNLVGQTPPDAEQSAHSEDELRMLFADSAKQGEIEPEEQTLLSRVFDFTDKTVKDVMVPRHEVVALAGTLTVEEALRNASSWPHSRFPVYKDARDNVLGILHIRDLLTSLNTEDASKTRIEDILRPALTVSLTEDLATLLGQFRRGSQHMAIVVGTGGTTAGIVTLEDLLEEIVGEISDEFDRPRRPLRTNAPDHPLVTPPARLGFD
jgi:CBS domain containing-hemolysin-like protein